MEDIVDRISEVNGKVYTLWGQFIERKKEFIGCVLEDLDMGMSVKTEVTDITLVPNGDSAFFKVHGKDFSCGFDVMVGGIIPGDKRYLTFYGYAGHTWRIQLKEIEE